MLTENEILNVLRNIVDPDFGKDIVSLGFVRNIRINGKAVSLDIQLTTPACPVKSEFQKQAEEAIRRLGAGEVQVNMTAPAKPSAAAATVPDSTLENVGSIIAVSSAKGGVGKSTVAAYMAQALADRGFKVGLLDADIHGPSVPTLFGLAGTNVKISPQKLFIPVEKNNLKIMSFGFLIGDAPAVMRGPMVTQYIQQILHRSAWGNLDYLFIDMPPGTGDVQLTITQAARLSGAVIVTTPQTLSLIDVARGILMFEKVSVPILGVVENMSYFICPDCSKEHRVFGRSSQSLQDRFGIDVLATWPLSEKYARPVSREVTDDPLIQETLDKIARAVGKMSIASHEIPKASFDQAKVTLQWADGRQVEVSNRTLRLSCRCALCMDEMSGKPILNPATIPPDIAPKSIIPLGNYAIGITWNDGHSSGIYPYKNIIEESKKQR